MIAHDLIGVLLIRVSFPTCNLCLRFKYFGPKEEKSGSSLSTFSSADLMVHWRSVRQVGVRRSEWERNKKGWEKPHWFVDWVHAACLGFSPCHWFFITKGLIICKEETDAFGEGKNKSCTCISYLLLRSEVPQDIHGHIA